LYDFHFEPALVGATPFWLAARFSKPGIIRLLVNHGADPLFVHHSNEVAESKGFKPKTEVTTALMAATGMGGGTAWVQSASGDLEAAAWSFDPARALKYQKCCRFSDGKRRQINRDAGARKVAKPQSVNSKFNELANRAAVGKPLTSTHSAANSAGIRPGYDMIFCDRLL
jgi:hypothetical protein